MNFDIKTNSYLPEQCGYAARVKSLLTEREVVNPKAHIVTFGCQQNVSDSERIKGMLCLCGYSLTENILYFLIPAPFADMLRTVFTATWAQPKN